MYKQLHTPGVLAAMGLVLVGCGGGSDPVPPPTEVMCRIPGDHRDA
jgi:hypothetical protein